MTRWKDIKKNTPQIKQTNKKRNIFPFAHTESPRGNLCLLHRVLSFVLNQQGNLHPSREPNDKNREERFYLIRKKEEVNGNTTTPVATVGQAQ